MSSTFNTILPMTPNTLRRVLDAAEAERAEKIAFAQHGPAFTALYHRANDTAWKVLLLPPEK